MKLVHWLVTLPVAIVAVAFAVENLERVPVGLWPFSDALFMPLYLVVLGALAVGFIAGEFVAWLNGGRWRREARRRRRRIEALERELAATQAQLPRHETSGLPANPRHD
ncbi:MAG TPA: lipopolysaccharide assembly protein LapA domain-containing protein [Stellaceae bacterium]|nr:lipopolysaccharide assembly protein LapA domain-containing protein [Stellaceae bacterium]